MQCFFLLLSIFVKESNPVMTSVVDEIQNIEDTVYPHTNVPVGSSVLNLTIEKVAVATAAPHRRKRGVDTYIPSKYDLILDTNSSYYDLIFGKCCLRFWIN